MDVAVWRGARAGMLHESAAEVALMPGCAEALGGLIAAGVTVAVITNGLHCVADRFSTDFGVAHVFGNRVVAEGGRLTGEIELLMPYGEKGEVLRALTTDLGLTASQVAAVGDSPADIAMFRAARIGVAFCPCDPSVAEDATHVVHEKNLRPLLDILL